MQYLFPSMSFTISWKIALFLLLGIALIIFLALRYSSIFPGTGTTTGSPIPLPILDKSGNAAMRQMPPVRHQLQQRPNPGTQTQIRSQQRQPPPSQQQQQQRRPVQETDMGNDVQDENEPGEDEEDPFFSPLN